MREGKQGFVGLNPTHTLKISLHLSYGVNTNSENLNRSLNLTPRTFAQDLPAQL